MPVLSGSVTRVHGRRGHEDETSAGTTRASGGTLVFDQVVLPGDVEGPSLTRGSAGALDGGYNVVLSPQAIKTLENPPNLRRTAEIKEIATALQRVLLFQNIPVAHCQQLATTVRGMSLPRHKVVCARGEPGSCMYVMVRGRASVHIDFGAREGKASKGGKAQGAEAEEALTSLREGENTEERVQELLARDLGRRVATIGPGDVFGEIGWTAKQRRAAFTVALDRLYVLFISSSEFNTHVKPFLQLGDASILNSRLRNILRAAPSARDREEIAFLERQDIVPSVALHKFQRHMHAALRGSVQLQTVPAGTLVSQQEDASSRFYIVLKGRLAAFFRGTQTQLTAIRKSRNKSRAKGRLKFALALAVLKSSPVNVAGTAATGEGAEVEAAAASDQSERLASGGQAEAAGRRGPAIRAAPTRARRRETFGTNAPRLALHQDSGASTSSSLSGAVGTDASSRAAKRLRELQWLSVSCPMDGILPSEAKHSRDPNPSLLGEEIGELTEGDSWGEAVLLAGHEDAMELQRTSMVALEPTELLAVEASEFRHAMMRAFKGKKGDGGGRRNDTFMQVAHAAQRPSNERTAEELRIMSHVLTTMSSRSFFFGTDEQTSRLLCESAYYRCVENEGQVVCLQGDEGNSFMMILHGSVSIHVKGATSIDSRIDQRKGAGTTRRYDATRLSNLDSRLGPAVESLGVGESFGELSLLRKFRTASVVARQPRTEFLVITRQAFDKVISAAGGAHVSLKEAVEKADLLQHMFRRSKFYKLMELSNLLKPIAPHKGQIVERAGTAGKMMFFVYSGEFRSMRGSTVVSIIGPGEIIGDNAIVSSDPSPYDVVASSNETKAYYCDAHELTRKLPDEHRKLLTDLAQAKLDNRAKDLTKGQTMGLAHKERKMMFEGGDPAHDDSTVIEALGKMSRLGDMLEPLGSGAEAAGSRPSSRPSPAGGAEGGGGVKGDGLRGGGGGGDDDDDGLDPPSPRYIPVNVDAGRLSLAEGGALDMDDAAAVRRGGAGAGKLRQSSHANLLPGSKSAAKPPSDLLLDHEDDGGGAGTPSRGQLRTSSDRGLGSSGGADRLRRKSDRALNSSTGGAGGDGRSPAGRGSRASNDLSGAPIDLFAGGADGGPPTPRLHHHRGEVDDPSGGWRRKEHPSQGGDEGAASLRHSTWHGNEAAEGGASLGLEDGFESLLTAEGGAPFGGGIGRPGAGLGGGYSWAGMPGNSGEWMMDGGGGEGGGLDFSAMEDTERMLAEMGDRDEDAWIRALEVKYGVDGARPRERSRPRAHTQSQRAATEALLRKAAAPHDPAPMARRSSVDLGALREDGAGSGHGSSSHTGTTSPQGSRPATPGDGGLRRPGSRPGSRPGTPPRLGAAGQYGSGGSRGGTPPPGSPSASEQGEPVPWESWDDFVETMCGGEGLKGGGKGDLRWAPTIGKGNNIGGPAAGGGGGGRSGGAGWGPIMPAQPPSRVYVSARLDNFGPAENSEQARVRASHTLRMRYLMLSSTRKNRARMVREHVASRERDKLPRKRAGSPTRDLPPRTATVTGRGGRESPLVSGSLWGSGGPAQGSTFASWRTASPEARLDHRPYTMASGGGGLPALREEASAPELGGWRGYSPVPSIPPRPATHVGPRGPGTPGSRWEGLTCIETSLANNVARASIFAAGREKEVPGNMMRAYAASAAGSDLVPPVCKGDVTTTSAAFAAAYNPNRRRAYTSMGFHEAQEEMPGMGLHGLNCLGNTPESRNWRPPAPPVVGPSFNTLDLVYLQGTEKKPAKPRARVSLESLSAQSMRPEGVAEAEDAMMGLPRLYS